MLDVRHRDRPVVSCGIGTDALGTPIDPDTLFAVYCSTKPVVALAIGLLVEDGELSWDDRLGDVVDEPIAAGLKPVTVTELLTHTAGLHNLRADHMLARSPTDRRTVARQHVPPDGWSSASHLAYSNFLGWFWLVRIIEAITDAPAREHLRSAVLDPLSLTGEIFTGFAPSEVAFAAAACAVNIDLTGSRPIPMLLERSPSFMSDPDLAAAGGYASIHGLCSLYQGLMTILDSPDEQAAGLPKHLIETMVEPRVAGREDPVMGRSGPWGLGFMVDLRHHRFGEHASARSFGHSGNAGASFAFCDPVHDLSVAVLYTAKVDNTYAVDIRRHAFLTNLYEALGLANEDL